MVPANVQFISAEPLLGPLDKLNLDGIHWLITGGESGFGHRLCNPDWVRNLRDRCLVENVAFFHKQWGGRTPKAEQITMVEHGMKFPIYQWIVIILLLNSYERIDSTYSLL